MQVNVISDSLETRHRQFRAIANLLTASPRHGYDDSMCVTTRTEGVFPL